MSAQEEQIRVLIALSFFLALFLLINGWRMMMTWLASITCEHDPVPGSFPGILEMQGLHFTRPVLTPPSPPSPAPLDHMQEAALRAARATAERRAHDEEHRRKNEAFITEGERLRAARGIKSTCYSRYMQHVAPAPRPRPQPPRQARVVRFALDEPQAPPPPPEPVIQSSFADRHRAFLDFQSERHVTVQEEAETMAAIKTFSFRGIYQQYIFGQYEAPEPVVAIENGVGAGAGGFFPDPQPSMPFQATMPQPAPPPPPRAPTPPPAQPSAPPAEPQTFKFGGITFEPPVAAKQVQAPVKKKVAPVPSVLAEAAAPPPPAPKPQVNVGTTVFAAGKTPGSFGVRK